MRKAAVADRALRVSRIGRALRFEQRLSVAATPAQLWPLVADTDRLNRAVGLPPVHYATKARAGGGTRSVAEYRLFGLPLARWDEAPFEWQYPRWYRVQRAYHWGALEAFDGGTELRPLPAGGTEVRIWADLTPRHCWWWPVVRYLLGPLGLASGIRQVAVLADYLAGLLDSPFPQLERAAGPIGLLPPPLRVPFVVRRRRAALPAGDAAAPLPVPNDDQAAGAWAALVGDSGALVDRLRRHLLTAPDDAVVKMRPFELADRWGTDRRDTLVLFLRATTAGLLTMTWDVLCPNCRIPKAQFSALRDLQTKAHCDTCDITYDATFDRSVEVRFTVSPALREVADQAFCIGGPMNTPHVVSQLTIDGGGTATLACQVEPGFYKLRSRQSAGAVLLDARPASPVAAALVPAAQAAPPAAALAVGAAAIEPAVLDVEPGDIRLAIANRLDVPATVVLERREWPDTAATAALVGTLQEFRDLFSSEVLAPGIQVAIQRLAFMFTDLSGSTAMYQAAGQAQAFRIVQDHFRILFAAIARHRGAVVKTIGDAVMATFPSAAAALEAALAIQTDVVALDTRGVVDTTTFVKIGLHQGPCVAVTANERLDYFGTTVNLAARVEHESRGGQITMTADVRDDPAVAARLEAGGYTLEPAVAQLRGIREPVRLVRLVDPRRGGDGRGETAAAATIGVGSEPAEPAGAPVSPAQAPAWAGDTVAGIVQFGPE